MKVAKIINEESELRLLRDKNKNKKIVLTSGCFDLLHYGHICHLEESKNCGDYLVVAVNSDDSVKRLKGNTKPVVPEIRYNKFRKIKRHGLQISGRMKLRHHHSKGDSKPCPKRLYS